MNEICEKILNNQLILIKSDIKCKLEVVDNLINEISLVKKEKTLLYSFRDSSKYFTYRILSFLSGIDVRDIAKYFEPCSWFSKGSHKINTNKLIEAIECAQKSPIVMFSNVEKTSDKDYIKYIFDDCDNDIFILVGINELCELYDLPCEEIMNKIRMITKNKHVVFVMSDKEMDRCSLFVDEIVEVKGIEKGKVIYDK